MTAERFIKVAKSMGYATEKEATQYTILHPKNDYDEWIDIRDLYRMFEPPYRCVKKSQAHHGYIDPRCHE